MIAQLVECLPCKLEALGSVPRTTEAQALYGGKYSPNTGEKEPGRSGVEGHPAYTTSQWGEGVVKRQVAQAGLKLTM